jgi:hypothetical protein
VRISMFVWKGVRYNKRVIAVISFLILLFPRGANAAGLVPCSGTDCTICSFVKLVDNVTEFVIGFGVLVGVALVMYAGFLLVTSAGNTEAMGKAKGLVINFLIGFLVLVFAWLIVHTVLLLLTGKGLSGNDAWVLHCTAPKPLSGGSSFNNDRAKFPDRQPQLYLVTNTPAVSTGAGSFSLRSCREARGPGWITVDAGQCDGTLGAGQSCCKYDAAQAQLLRDRAAEAAKNELPYSSGYNDAEKIPPGFLWCYEESGYYTCSSTKTSCEDTLRDDIKQNDVSARACTQKSR